jgi:hypothetical protein
MELSAILHYVELLSPEGREEGPGCLLAALSHLLVIWSFPSGLNRKDFKRKWIT